MEEEKPGLREYETSLLLLLEKITNGCHVEINRTGTSVLYRPGVVIGGKNLTHDCPSSRCITYFAEVAALLAPFAKDALEISFTGVTNGVEADVGVDTFRSVTLPNLARFGVDEASLDFQISKRGAPPCGGGLCTLRCNPCRTLRPLLALDDGLVRRIRGVAYCARTSPQLASRMSEAAKGLLNQHARDVFIFLDARSAANSGESPGFSITLVAETTTGCLYSAECNGAAGDVAEEVGQRAAVRLLHEIARRGCVDTGSQWHQLLFMALATEDVSKVRLGKISEFTVECLRLFKEMLGVTFKMVPDPETKTVLFSCMGLGFSNISKRIY